mgnify:FL=1
MNDITAFFAFLRYCLGYKRDMSRVVAGMNWQELYSFASKQAILGLCFEGIERLGMEYSEELRRNPIERDLLMTWMGAAQQIRRLNMKVNAVAGELYSKFREDGLRCCILNGIGEIAIPTTAFNVIYQLTHLYHHFFDEGIGMRQIIDYYYVVNNDELLVIKDALQRELKHLGLWKFAGALIR